eukprot:TRINITY_DN1071_c1_g1_i2.p1 TRINITY_DN1071_c1_g1~~TRINITY_DN1071_c1_g1_i2.p1  ORF type:complete len:219 (+),score=59.19 TRINITY_DN1071_c1_g1_i2:136-792(+)
MPAAHRRGSVLLAVAAFSAPALLAFSGSPGPVLRPRFERSLVTTQAEGSSGSGSSSVALVKVNEANSITTAGLLGGVAGFLFGGVWIAGVGFVASSYLARKKDDDIATILKGVSAGGLSVLNYIDSLNSEYQVTAKVGSALSDALESDGSNPAKSLSDAVAAFDQDVGIKDTLGNVFTATGELAAQAVDKAIELNEEYKILDQIQEKISSASSSSSTK